MSEDAEYLTEAGPDAWPKTPIPCRELVPKADYDALAARLAAAEARLAEVEAERDAAGKAARRVRRPELPDLIEVEFNEDEPPAKIHVARLAEVLRDLALRMAQSPATPVPARMLELAALVLDEWSDRDRLAAANAELQAEIERLQTAIRRASLMGNPDNIRRELRAALAPAADASGEVTP